MLMEVSFPNREQGLANKDTDFAYEIESSRFRVNVFADRNGIGAAVTGRGRLPPRPAGRPRRGGHADVGRRLADRIRFQERRIATGKRNPARNGTGVEWARSVPSSATASKRPRAASTSSPLYTGLRSPLPLPTWSRIVPRSKSDSVSGGENWATLDVTSGR